MKRKRNSYRLLAVFVVCAAMVLQAWAASHKSEPAILPADAALYSWGYYAFSELAWASRESNEAVAMSPLEMDALKSVPDGHVGEVDVARHVLAISRTSNIVLVDIPTWETLRTFDTGQSIRRIALAPNLNKIAFITCPPDTISDCWLGLLDVASGNIRKTAAKDVSAASTLSWQPDNKGLLYISTDSRIISYLISERRARVIGTGISAAYSPDGLTLAYAAEYGIVIRNIRTGGERTFSAEWWDLPRWRFAKEPSHYSLHWHKAGRFLAFTADVMKVLPDDLVSPGVYSCNVLDVETGDYVTLFDEKGGTCGPWHYK